MLYYVMSCHVMLQLFFSPFSWSGDLFSFVHRVKKSAEALVARDADSNPDLKFMDAALMVDEFVAEKYGEAKLTKHLLLIGNIVSMLPFNISAYLI